MKKRSPTVEIPAALMEQKRSHVTQDEIDQNIRFIEKFVAELKAGAKPGPSPEEMGKLDRAAEAAKNVRSIRPLTEFMTWLDIGLVLKAQEAYDRFKADEKADLVQ